MPQHVRMRFELEPSFRPCSLDHASKTGRGVPAVILSLGLGRRVLVEYSTKNENQHAKFLDQIGETPRPIRMPSAGSGASRQAAIEALILVVTLGGPTMFAHRRYAGVEPGARSVVRVA
jgi:hypothetical protein